MGLDSFWRAPEGADCVQPHFEMELKLCGGMFSGNGEGSFRGKVYSDLIEGVTGESLYQEVISNDTVRKMAAALQGLDEMPRPASIYGRPAQWSYSQQELHDLKRMFI